MTSKNYGLIDIPYTKMTIVYDSRVVLVNLLKHTLKMQNFACAFESINDIFWYNWLIGA